MSASPVEIEGVGHWFGEGALRRQILFDISAVIHGGEIVIVSGPSGSGKTTLLTLIGALRSTQVGSLRVLGRELRGASESALTEVRKQIGYVFQSHNLIDALTVRQNVQMGSQLLEPVDGEKRADALLASVGLAEYGARRPSELSGGQRQRVAIARALAADPRVILADEPTASLDRETGRQIVMLLQALAREQGVTVLLVTHDTRILDVADRILSLEDGRISSFMSAVTEGTRHLWGLLARDLRQNELVQRVHELPIERFVSLLEQVTEETGELLQMIEVAQSETFDSALAQVLEAFALKAAQLVGADRTRVYLVDPADQALFSLAAKDKDATQELRSPLSRGIAGRVARSGAPARVERVLEDPDFDAGVDVAAASASGVLALPLHDAEGHTFAVIELAQHEGQRPFRAADSERLAKLAASLSAVLQTWFRMSCSCRKGKKIAGPSVCCEAVGACEHAAGPAVAGRPTNTS